MYLLFSWNVIICVKWSWSKWWCSSFMMSSYADGNVCRHVQPYAWWTLYIQLYHLQFHPFQFLCSFNDPLSIYYWWHFNPYWLFLLKKELPPNLIRANCLHFKSHNFKQVKKNRPLCIVSSAINFNFCRYNTFSCFEEQDWLYCSCLTVTFDLLKKYAMSENCFVFSFISTVIELKR